jgi:hypothetical protein
LISNNMIFSSNSSLKFLSMVVLPVWIMKIIKQCGVTNHQNIF